MKNLLFLAGAFILFASCSPDKAESSVFWISGFKTSCNPDSDSDDCWWVTKSDSLDGQQWDVLHARIEGFEFEEGYLKKVKVASTGSEGTNADIQKPLTYRLVEELDKKPDNRFMLDGDWQLENLAGETLAGGRMDPNLTLDLREMKIRGNAGCNSYNGSIQNLGMQSITFGGLLNTLSTCENQATEDRYLRALNEVRMYKIEGSKLHLTDAGGETLLVFAKKEGTKNSIRIHDIWMAVRVDGYPINRMVTIPRLEVNTAEMKVFGHDGCNDYFGAITELTESGISLGNIGSTRKMCPEMEMPERYLSALSRIRAYSFEERFLVFTDEEGKEVLAFMKSD